MEWEATLKPARCDAYLRRVVMLGGVTAGCCLKWLGAGSSGVLGPWSHGQRKKGFCLII